MSYETWSKEALIRRLHELESTQASKQNAVIQPQFCRKKTKQMDFSKYHSRFVAIRFAYLGWNYHGLAHQKDSNVKTVEGEILNAFYKTRCIPEADVKACDLSRCGRTDAEVSAMSQVISLKLRSNLSLEEQQDTSMDQKELDYLKILNSHLPADILAYEICLRPPADFDARFSCTYRHYRYYFEGLGLDVAKMREAALLLEGDHDFRNFCRVDASKQITNFVRTILLADIVQDHGDLYYLSLKGTAFLWNQVRSIMAILFLVGRGLEPVSSVSRLLDVEQTPNKPAYEIASGSPLVLYDCGYPEMEWKCSPYTSRHQLFNLWYEHAQRTNMARLMLSIVESKTQPLNFISGVTGCGLSKWVKSPRHVSIFERPKLATPEEVNTKWLQKRQN